ncbi:MAG: flagellar biosynthetic protein FliP, partial [Bosea sp. (in: a-proteobacteria)]|nr:flagellar biosynthetic protein FliP [Bosea sp. (in: a-proteobacteria)]
MTPHLAIARRRLGRSLAGAVLLLGLLAAPPALPQTLSLDLGQGGGVAERALQLIAVITVLSLAPSILVMVTSFTRIVVVLSLLRSALGTQTAPPNAVIIGLSLFLTGFVMAPTLREAYTNAVQPLMAGQIQPQEAYNRGVVPFKAFMLKNVREKDLQLFLDMSQGPRPQTPQDIGIEVLVP